MCLSISKVFYHVVVMALDCAVTVTEVRRDGSVRVLTVPAFGSLDVWASKQVLKQLVFTWSDTIGCAHEFSVPRGTMSQIHGDIVVVSSRGERETEHYVNESLEAIPHKQYLKKSIHILCPPL